jgi:hypothetical protein
MIDVEIHFVNGDLQTLKKDDIFIQRLHALTGHGLTGKELIHELLTDDWGKPLCAVHIMGQISTGEEINVVIPYT